MPRPDPTPVLTTLKFFNDKLQGLESRLGIKFPELTPAAYAKPMEVPVHLTGVMALLFEKVTLEVSLSREGPSYGPGSGGSAMSLKAIAIQINKGQRLVEFLGYITNQGKVQGLTGLTASGGTWMSNMQRLAELRNGRRLAELRQARAGKQAMEFSSPEALKEYLKEHPGADKSKHTVTKGEEGGGGGKKDDEGDKKPVALSREGYKAVADSLEGFGGEGSMGHVLSYAISGKPMDAKHVKKVVDEIDGYLRSWKTYADHNKWTPKDKKNLTRAKGILENSLGKTAGAHFANSADMRAAATSVPTSLSDWRWRESTSAQGKVYTWSNGTQAFQLEPGQTENSVVPGARWKLRWQVVLPDGGGLSPVYNIPKTFTEPELPHALKLALTAFTAWQKGALSMRGPGLSSIPHPWFGDKNQKPLL